MKKFILLFSTALLSVTMSAQINYSSKLFRNHEEPILEKVTTLKARPILDSIRLAYADSVCANGKTVKENFYIEIADNIADAKEYLAAIDKTKKDWIAELDKLEKQYTGRLDGSVFRIKKSEIDEKYYCQLESLLKDLKREWHMIILESSLMYHEFETRWRNAGLYYFALSKIWNDDTFTYEYWTVHDFLLTDVYKNDEMVIPVLQIVTKFFSDNPKDIEYIRYTPLNM